MMGRWFIGKGFLAEEKARLKKLGDRRHLNRLQMQRDHEKLRVGLAKEIGSATGLSLSFGAGCAAVLAYKNRKHLGILKKIPWGAIVQSALGTAMQEQSVSDQHQQDN